MEYKMTKPCEDCPFRRGTPMRLRRGRVHEISNAVLSGRGEFPCHKTIVYLDDPDEQEHMETEQTQHCAGALIYAWRQGQPSQMMRICARLNCFNPDTLLANKKNVALVFRNFAEMLKHHRSKQNEQ